MSTLPCPTPVCRAASHRQRWSVGLVAGLVIVAGAWLSGSAIDQTLLLEIQARLTAWPAGWSFLTWSGLGVCGFVLLTSLSATEPRRVAALILTLLIGGIIVHALKRWLDVGRPAGHFGLDDPAFHVIGQVLIKGSMPSGHAASAWAVATLLVLTEGKPVIWRNLWLALAALQGLSRIVVGAHWPSDVLVGAGMGLLLASAIWRWGGTARFGQWIARPQVSRFVALCLPGLGLFLCFSDQGWALPLGVSCGVMLLCCWGAWDWWRAASRPSITAGRS
jgi:membrane-associated phospholipid phosphatase